MRSFRARDLLMLRTVRLASMPNRMSHAHPYIFVVWTLTLVDTTIITITAVFLSNITYIMFSWFLCVTPQYHRIRRQFYSSAWHFDNSTVFLNAFNDFVQRPFRYDSEIFCETEDSQSLFGGGDVRVLRPDSIVASVLTCVCLPTLCTRNFLVSQ